MNRESRCLLAALLCMGCAPSYQPELEFQAAALQQELAQAFPAANHPSLPFELSVQGTGERCQVSLEARGASLHLVVDAMLEQSGIPYLLDLPIPAARLSTCLHRVSFLAALETLLRPHGLEARWHGQHGRVLLITEAPALVPGPVGTGDVQQRQALLRYQPPSSLMSSLLKGQNGLWSSNANVTLANRKGDPRLFVAGPAQEVQTVLSVVRQADLPIPELAIDVAILNVTESLSTIFSALYTASGGPVQQIFGGPGEEGGNQVAADSGGLLKLLFTEPTDIPVTFGTFPNIRAVISRLHDQIISRSQMRVLSGQTASSQVGRTGYLLITPFATDIPTLNAKPIPTGNILNITPRVLGSGQILLTVSAEFSDFSPAPVNDVQIIANKFTNLLTSQALVRDGQAMILGGVKLIRAEYLHGGYPGLRQIPVVNVLAQKFTDGIEATDAMFIIRPRILREGGLTDPFISRPVQIPCSDENLGEQESAG